MVDGYIYRKTFDADGFGHYIIMKDSKTGMGFLYGHMREASPKNVGDSVQIGEFVGYERNYWKFYRDSLAFRNARYIIS